jgi:hypothetical protein
MLVQHRTNYLNVALLLFGIFATQAFAQGDGDPPSRVARLNLMQGTVSMEPAGADEWVPGIINRPFTTGDFLFADAGSHAELHLDTAVIRMNEQTSFGFLNLGDQVAQLQLSEGELQVHVRRLNSDDVFEVDTPNAAITLLREGDYLFSVDPNNGTTFLVIRHGQAEITGGGQAFTLQANQSVRLSGTDSLGYDVENAPALDDFESFCLQRDQREAHLQSTRYVPADMIGYEDLDANGTWRNTPDYGPVWYPTAVDAGWAPYHNGHWAWVDPWGWTWVDDMPWGFAPFHYGRWAYVGGAWGWTPGPVAVVAVGRPVVRPVYAPALVAFIGGASWGVAVGFGGGGPRMGWVPLGPGELYSPAYHVSPGYYNHVNVANTTINRNVNITNVYNTTYVNKTVVNNTTIINNNQRYVNMQAPNAVMTMPQTAFASGQTASRVGAPVARQDVSKIQMSSAIVAPPVAPTRQSLTAGYNPGQKAVPQPAAQVMSRPIVAKVAPPAAPVAFAAQQQALQRNAGQVFNANAVRTSVSPVAAKPAVSQVRIANQGQTVAKTNVMVGQKVGPPVAVYTNTARPPSPTQPIAVSPANNPVNNPLNNPANHPANLPGGLPNRVERPANPQPNVTPAAAQPMVKTNPNVVVNQPTTVNQPASVNQPPAAAPNNAVNPGDRPTNLHGVPPNRRPDVMQRTTNPPANVNPAAAQPVVKTPPQPPAQVEAYKPPPPPPTHPETYRPPAETVKPAQPVAHAQSQSTKPTHKPTKKEEEERKKTEH